MTIEESQSSFACHPQLKRDEAESSNILTALVMVKQPLIWISREYLSQVTGACRRETKAEAGMMLMAPSSVTSLHTGRNEQSSSPSPSQMCSVSCIPFWPNKHQSNGEPSRPHPSIRLGARAAVNQTVLRKRSLYFFFSPDVCSFSTFLTIFCSSIRKARTIRSWTQLAHREPP